MDRIITDNSKVNEKLLNEVKSLTKQNKELKAKNKDLQEQLITQRVSQQRELLLGFAGQMQSINVIRPEKDVEKYVENFIANNCG